MKFYWNDIAQSWNCDFWDEAGLMPIILGVPLVTGSDLLDQFGHLDIGAYAILTVMTVGPDLSPDAVPSFDNLGDEGHLYMSTP